MSFFSKEPKKIMLNYVAVTIGFILLAVILEKSMGWVVASRDALEAKDPALYDSLAMLSYYFLLLLLCVLFLFQIFSFSRFFCMDTRHSKKLLMGKIMGAVSCIAVGSVAGFFVYFFTHMPS